MKKNMSGIILAAEIFTIILFHSFQLRQDDHKPVDALARAEKASASRKMELHAKPAYIYLPLLK
jgi:hypothetical protein